MGFTQDFIGTFIEVLMTIFFMNLFSSKYIENKLKLALSIVLISLGVSLLDKFNTPYTAILNYLLVVVILSSIIKRHFFNVLFEVIFSAAFILFIEYILAVVFYKIEGIDSLEFYNRIFQLIIAFIICFGLGVSRKLQKVIQRFYIKYQEEIYFIAVTLFCFCAIELYLWKSENDIVFNQSSVILLYTIIWFCLSLFLLKKLIENRKQKENICLHEQYVETTENLLDGLYSDKHDFNKHLQAIQGLCECEEAIQAVNEIKGYIETLKLKELNEKKRTVSINTGNGVVNALLYSKNKEAEKNEIQLYYLPSGKFPGFPCEQYELVQIIGNLLDNAFEYVCSLEKVERRVILNICENKNDKKIEVRNTYYVENSGKVSISHEKSCSTKLGERRGYGLQNVKAITSKYHGKFNIFQEENEFVVEILL